MVAYPERQGKMGWLHTSFAHGVAPKFVPPHGTTVDCNERDTDAEYSCH
jgi:hypothetical protein